MRDYIDKLAEFMPDRQSGNDTSCKHGTPDCVDPLMSWTSGDRRFSLRPCYYCGCVFWRWEDSPGAESSPDVEAPKTEG